MQPVTGEDSQHFTVLRAAAAVWLAVFSLLLPRLPAQTPSIQFERLSVEHGLSQSSVTCILQDRKGYMWFGTLNGLNRYDGYNFTDYRHDPEDPSSLSNDQITCIFEAENGGFWIGTQNGLNRFDQRKGGFTRFTHRSGDARSLSHNLIGAIHQDRSGVLWVGTASGLNRFDPSEETFTRYGWNPNSPVGLSSNFITAIHEDARGALWIGTKGGGLNKFDAQRRQVAHYLRQDNNLSLSYSPAVLRALDRRLRQTPSMGQILRLRNSMSVTKTVQLHKPQHLLVVACGEATDQKHDYGWLEQDGKVVWEMQLEEARHAGGAAKNRLQIGVIDLPPGKYQLSFRTDDSHTFGQWNHIPPSRPELWGIRLIPIDAEEREFFSVALEEFVRPSTVSSNHIRKIFEDREGRIWIATNGGGLNRFEPQKESFEVYRHLHESVVSTYSNAVQLLVDSLRQSTPALAKISRVGDGLNLTQDFHISQPTRALVLTMGEASEKERFDFGWLLNEAGQRVWQMEIVRTRHAGGAPKNRLEMSVIELAPGSYTLGYESDGSHAFQRWNAEPPVEPDLWGVQVLPVDQDMAKRLAIELAKKALPTTVGSNFVRDICQDQSGLIWLATSNGLSSFDSERRLFSTFQNNPTEPFSLSADNLEAICVDKTGIVWIGTILGGINKLTPNKNHFKRFVRNPFVENTLNHRVVYSFLEDRAGLVWIGTWGGLSLFDPETETFRAFTGGLSRLGRLPSSVMALHEDGSGNIWIGTNGGGLFEVDAQNSSVRHYLAERGNPKALPSNIIHAIHEQENGMLWFGTYNGLCKLADPKAADGKKRFQCYASERNNPQSLSHSGIRTILQDVRGIMWIGTNGGGLNRFDPMTESFTHYKNEPANSLSLSHNVVTSIYEGNYPYLWITTYGGGLNRFDRQTQTFTRYTERDGLPNNVLYGILADELGNLWISTNNGLSKFDPDTEAFTNYDLENGLQSSEFNTGAYLKLRNGEMIFGGINGFNKFHPKEIRTNPHPPELVITSFKKFNETVWFDKNISEVDKVALSYKDNFISFEFAALDYTNPKKNQYAYQLEGFDADWVACGNRRFASYTNLDPGAYRFRVQGSNNDGLWNEQGASIRIEVIPPWWQTWWFKTALLFALVGQLVLGHRLRVRALQRRQRRLENLVGERTRELQSQKELAEKAKATIEKQAKDLQQMDRIKSRFFANISHEFRTPLTLILSPLEQMLANGHDDKSKRVFRTMRRNARRLLRLINQLLDLSQLESMKLALRPTLFDLTKFSSSVVSSFMSMAESKSIALRFAAPSHLTGYFDRDKLEKILFNLLSNAVKFTPSGGQVFVEIALKETRDEPRNGVGDGSRSVGETPLERDLDLKKDLDFSDGADLTATQRKKELQVTVRDTGVGIPADRLPFIFDRFYKANGAGSDHYEGTGIGLALTKELIALHRGRIEVQSKPRRGTEFIVTLPWRGAKISTDGKEAASYCPTDTTTLIESWEASENTEFGLATSDKVTKRNAPLVLVVEDHPEVQRYIQEHLGSHYRLMTAVNGNEGFKKALERIPDLVISDVMMPEMDGYEFCRTLKADERTSHIPVILLTAKAGLDDKLAGLGLGADDYLTKPFDLKELRVRVQNLIQQRNRLREQFAKRVILESHDFESSNPDEAFLQKLCDTVDQQLHDTKFGAEALSRTLGLSPRQLQRKIRALTDQTPIQLIRGLRLRRARRLLEAHHGNIAQVAYQVGFNNLSYFSKCFRAEFGMLPSEIGEHKKLH